MLMQVLISWQRLLIFEPLKLLIWQQFFLKASVTLILIQLEVEIIHLLIEPFFWLIKFYLVFLVLFFKFLLLIISKFVSCLNFFKAIFPNHLLT